MLAGPIVRTTGGRDPHTDSLPERFPGIAQEIRERGRWPLGRPEVSLKRGGPIMLTILLIIVLIILLGGGGGYYAHGRYGAPGLGGVLGLVIIVLVVLWLVGALTGGVGPTHT